MRSATNSQEFISRLRADNMDVVFRQNEQGRIYGVTFIDHNSKFVLNGSRLGKEFSANKFHELFSGAEQKPNHETPPARIPIEPILIHGEQRPESRVAAEYIPISRPQFETASLRDNHSTTNASRAQDQNYDPHTESVIGAFDIFSTALADSQSAEDFEEIQQIQLKKKKQRKM